MRGLLALRRPGVAAALACASAVSCLAGPADGWVRGQDVGRPFLDLASPDARLLPLGRASETTLPLPFQFQGALYDTLVVGPEPGLARLEWRDEASRGIPPVAEDDAHGDLPVRAESEREVPRALILRPLGAALSEARGSVIQLRSDGASVAVRWAGLQHASAQPAAFEVLLSPTGEIVYQYLQVPSVLASSPHAAGVTLEDTSRPGSLIEPSLSGFAARPGEVVVFPPDSPWEPLAGCGIAPNWCTVATAADSGCRTPHFPDDASTCVTTQSKRWHFNEGMYCRSCPYVFYVTVECGTEMHLPFRDMEGNQVRITDVFTGTELELEAMNDCAKLPFEYCDECPGNGIIPDLPGFTCRGGRRIDCIPYLQRSTLIQWGFPFTDRDGDGALDDLPCGPPNGIACGGSGAYAGHEEQNTDVVLHGTPALCGVFRLELVSGGFHWWLAANCTGVVSTDPLEIEKNFNVYQNCADALAAFDPITELVLTRFDFTGVCPDINLQIEVTNIGCVDAPASPVRIDFSRPNQDDIDLDLGPIPPGGSVARAIPVSLRSTPMDATATVDPDNRVAECSEQPALSFSGCEPGAGLESITTVLCPCVNTVHAAVVEPRLFACDGADVTIDASPSSAAPCSGGQVQWRFTDSTGRVVRNWAAQPTMRVTPDRCPSIEEYTVEVRCSAEVGPECIKATLVEVECLMAPDVTVGVAPAEVCAGDPVVVSASPGFVAYEWQHGASGRVIQASPTGATTYRVVATDARGCTSTGQVSVSVRPDPMPGPLFNTLRARREGIDVLVSYAELPMPVGRYELVAHQPAGLGPCISSLPPGKPTPLTMQAAAPVATAAPGEVQPALVHRAGAVTCPHLLYYKVLATSACTGRRGPACEPWPMQLLPCP